MARALRLNVKRLRHPYGDGRTGERIADTLASIDLKRLPLAKCNAY
jgi:hypothetical protein